LTASTIPSLVPRLIRGWLTIPATSGMPIISSISAATDTPCTDPIARRRSPSPVLLTALRASIVN